MATCQNKLKSDLKLNTIEFPSSLEYLNTMTLDQIKIGCNIIIGIEKNPPSYLKIQPPLHHILVFHFHQFLVAFVVETVQLGWAV